MSKITVFRLAILLFFAAIFANLTTAANGAKTESQTGVATTYLDFFGNGLTDFAILTASAGGPVRWRVLRNDNPAPPGPGQAGIFDIAWGQVSTDFIPNPGNYSGNGITDLTIYRSANGNPANHYITLPINQSPQPPGGAVFFKWGSANDIIGAEGDYDGDGIMDPTVVRTSGTSLVWYIHRSSDSTLMAFLYGTSTDIALPGADYTGDGAADPAVARVGANGTLTFIVGTTGGTLVSFTQWGDFNTDFIIPGGDYDGDGKADFMVWRGFGSSTNGAWYLRTASGNMSARVFGIPGSSNIRDTALRGGDYDGDGKADISVYRPSNTTFYVLRSSDGNIIAQQWGVPGNTNLPVASFGTQ